MIYRSKSGGVKRWAKMLTTAVGRAVVALMPSSSNGYGLHHACGSLLDHFPKHYGLGHDRGCLCTLITACFMAVMASLGA